MFILTGQPIAGINRGLSCLTMAIREGSLAMMHELELNASLRVAFSGIKIPTAGGRVVPIKDEYRRKAEFYLRLAATATDPVAVDGLTALAADYFELSQGGHSAAIQQQQQQTQPETPQGKKRTRTDGDI
jgi:hypothetical protein